MRKRISIKVENLPDNSYASYNNIDKMLDDLSNNQSVIKLFKQTGIEGNLRDVLDEFVMNWLLKASSSVGKWYGIEFSIDNPKRRKTYLF